MPKIPEGKKGVFTLIDKDIYSKLWDFIKKKYGENVYGALSFEIEKALEHYLNFVELHTNAHKLENPSLPRSHREAQKIISLIRNRGFHKQVPVNEVYKAISDIRGSDPRTLKKWLKFMVIHGYFRWINSRILEISPGLKEAEDFFSKLKERGDL